MNKNLLKKVCAMILIVAAPVILNAQSFKSHSKQGVKSNPVNKVLAGYDGSLLEVNTSNGYSMWPKVSTDSVSFIGTIKNNGINFYPGVDVNVEVTDQANNVVYSASVSYGGMNPGAAIPYNVGNFYPNVKDSYTAKTWCTIQGFTDEDGSNDTVYAYFQVNDSILARDYAIFGDPQDPQTLNDFDTLSKLGNIFQITKADYLTSVYFELTGAASTNDTVRASVFSVTSGLPDQLIAQSVITNITVAGAPSTYVLPIEGGPLLLQPGSYMVCVNEYEGNINIGSTQRIFLPATSWIYYHNPTDGYDGWYPMETFGAAYFRTFVLRPVFGCTLDAQITSTNETCNNANGSASINVSGESGNVFYNWSNGGTTSSINNLFFGNYTCEVTDEAGCSQFVGVFVSNIPGPSLSLISVNPVICFGESSGAALVGASSGVGPYDYLWSNGFTSDDQIGIPSGTYTVTVTDQNACTATIDFFVDQPSQLTSSTTWTDVTCNGFNNGVSTVIANGGTGNYYYNWSNGETTDVASNLMPGVNYEVTVTDDNGCTNSASTFLTEPPPITYNSNLTDLLCFGQATGAIGITASGGVGNYSYLWSNGETTDNISNLSAGVYNVTITDGNGCSLTDSLTLTQPSELIAVASGTDVSCYGLSDGAFYCGTTGGTGPYTYLWSSGLTTDTIYNQFAGTQTVTVTDFNNCTTSALATIIEPQQIVVTATGSDIYCFGDSTGTADVSATGGSGGFSFLWSNGETVQNLTGLGVNTYSVTVYDVNNCSASGTVSVNSPPDLVNTLSATADNGTGNGTATVVASGGVMTYSYAWQTNPVQTNATATGLATGIYFVITTDANGCIQTDAILVPTSTGINASNSGVSLFDVNPNPAIDLIAINIELNELSDITLNMFDAAGRQVFAKEFNNQVKLNTLVDISIYEKGIYLLTMQTNKGLVSKRLIIQ